MYRSHKPSIESDRAHSVLCLLHVQSLPSFHVSRFEQLHRTFTVVLFRLTAARDLKPNLSLIPTETIIEHD